MWQPKLTFPVLNFTAWSATHRKWTTAVIILKKVVPSVSTIEVVHVVSVRALYRVSINLYLRCS